MESSKLNKTRDLPSSVVNATLTAQPLPPNPKAAVAIKAKVVCKDKSTSLDNEYEEQTYSTVSKNTHSSVVADLESENQEEEKVLDLSRHEDDLNNGSTPTEVDEVKPYLKPNNSFRSKLTAKSQPEVDDIHTQAVQKKIKWELLGIIVLLLSISIPTLIFFTDSLKTSDSVYINTKSIQIMNDTKLHPVRKP